MLWTSSPFIDRRHDRTFVWIKGEPVSMHNLTPTSEMMKKIPLTTVGVQKEPPKGTTIDYSWALNEVVDHGLIAVKSKLDNFYIGLVWAKARWLRALPILPCIHSEPEYPEIHPGNRLKITGRLYFHEGSLEGLEKRYLSDEKKKAFTITVH
jgi:hypothetical protein